MSSSAVMPVATYGAKADLSAIRDASDMSNLGIAQPFRRLRAGIVGGGRGAFIGSVHRIAAELDGQAQVVAGAMSSHPEIARESAAAWFLERAYTSYEDM